MRKNIINIVTLGCSKNVVDSEHLMARLKNSGLEVVHDSNDVKAKVVIINTCGFIGDAKEESIDTILRYARAKEEGLIEHLFVMGCLSERYRDELRNEIPEVDSFFGVKNLADVVSAVGGDPTKELIGERELTTPKHYAYLKISEGCDRRCGYCAIPFIRGAHQSVPIEELLVEAKALASKGVKELLVIAQDTTYYGLDLYGERRLPQLLRELCKVDGIEWIRLHYAYPASFPDFLIEVMKSEPKICHYIDIPLQHISDNVLSSMHRNTTAAETRSLIARLREAMPDIAIRTTMLVGYPGETQNNFEELKRFVSETRFDRLGAFAYSPEEGTYSYEKLIDDVSDEEKSHRLEELMELQASISASINERYVGEKLEVIIDRKEGEYYIGRSRYDSPEVDQEIAISSPKPLSQGRIVTVTITSSEEYDLIGIYSGE